MREVFEGLLTLEHMSTHLAHRFLVPRGVQTLGLDFSFSPGHPGVGNIPHQLSISVYGPGGTRGTRHNNADQSPVISTSWASPGYLAGPIEAGEWSVEIDVHRILPPGGVSYRIEIVRHAEELEGPTGDEAPAMTGGGRRRGPGWYSGDLHGHTFHSDGKLSPAEYVDYAKDRGYDFVALTDHNTVSALSQFRQLAGETIATIPGMELTTFNGHALALGREDIVEWRVREGSTMSGLARSLQAAGSLYVIAHPRKEGHPFCTGCRWAYSDMLPGPARHVEVWNGPWSGRSHNDEAIQMFYAWLNSGYRMVATSGTDTHRRLADNSRYAVNRIHAGDNTPEELLTALSRGHSYITCGPELTLAAESADGNRAEMGDLVPAGKLRIVAGCKAGGVDLTGLDARLIRQGTVAESWPCVRGHDTVLETQAEAGCWIALELRDRSGGLHALSNPIHVGREGEPWR